MKILFITDNFPPESNAPATRTYEHCKRWVKFGADVTVITCFPNFPKGIIYEGFKNKIIQKSKVDDIKVVRVWSYITKNEGFFKRILDYASFSLSSFIAGLTLEFDIVISTSPQFFTSFTGYLLSVLKRKKWVFEVRDLWPSSIAAVGSIKRDSFIYRVLEKIELALYRKANNIVVVTSNFKKNLIYRGIEANKIHIVYNGIDDGFTKKISHEKRTSLRKKLNINDKIIIGYIGTIGMAHDLISIVKKINLLPSKYHILLIGEGAAKDEIAEFLKKEKLKKITLLDSIPKKNVPDYISSLDLSLIHLRKCDTFKDVIPSKIFENAAMNKTIILGVEGESKKILEKYDLGYSFEPSNFDSFLLALEMSEENKNLRTRREQFLKDFSRESQAKILYQKLTELVKA